MQHILEEDLYLTNTPEREENPALTMPMQSMSDI